MSHNHPSDNPQNMTVSWAVENLSYDKIIKHFNQVCREQDITRWIYSKEYFFDVNGKDIHSSLVNILNGTDDPDISYLYALKLIAWNYELITNCPKIKCWEGI